MSHETPSRISRLLRWTARILSMLYLAFFLFMLIAHLVEDPGQFAALTFREGLGFLFVGVLFVGYLLGWKWEILGGALGVVATIAFSVAIGNPGPLLLILPIPGFLYLSSGALSRRRAHRTEST